MNASTPVAAPARSLPALLLAALFVAGSLWPARAAEAVRVRQFDTYDIVLRSAKVYDGAGGSPNPFVDVGVHARVRTPSGKFRIVHGFFDGDGKGGQRGNVWRIRLQPDERGRWRWVTSSNDGTLARKRGILVCARKLAGPFGKGPIEVSPRDPRRFAHRHGPSVLLLGKFLDVAAPSPLRYSHTFLSEELDDGDRAAMLARHQSMRLNKMNVYLANRGDYGGVSTTPWVGSAASPDRGRFDLRRWHDYERWIERLRDEGIAAQIWFFADDSSFGDLPEADRHLLAQYAMARLSAYSNTLFTLVLEWQEGWSTAEVQRLAEAVDQRNPWHRLQSVHGTTGDFAFAGADWTDYLDVQAGNGASHTTVHASSLRHRSTGKPLIQEEHGLGEENRRNRQNAWAALMGGAAGIGTGAFLEPLAIFAGELPLDDLAPAQDDVESGKAYALSGKGETHALYLPDGGTVRVALANRGLTARWFDPRSGKFGAPFPLGAGTVTLNAPSKDDWALLARP